ncbi:DsbA family protein [Catenuloplanes japonicus]|uniref:DsbA family protein n=1 Tax=Catenuloplanes japonicus TaxID=33876 RepID=UPI000691479F|nr:thioredoxin domain-containing protein [Catenuloplanes japonicus]
MVAMDHVFGNADAPVTVTEYGDYQCPYCAGAAPVLRTLVEESDGQVRLIFRNFPLFEIHPYALTAALAAESTASAGVFWDMHHVLFKKQDRLEDAFLRHYAEAVGADPALATGEAAQQFAPKVQEDYAAGVACGIAGTPSLLINDTPYEGRIELAELRRATSLTLRRA